MFSEEAYYKAGPSLAQSIYAGSIPGDFDPIQAEDVFTNLSNDNLNAYPAIRQKETEKQFLTRGGKTTVNRQTASAMEQDIEAFNRISAPDYQGGSTLIGNMYSEETEYDPYNIIYTNTAEVLEGDRALNIKNRKDAAWDAGKEATLGSMYTSWLERKLNNKTSEKITRTEAEQLSKDFGLDLKWDKENIPRFEVMQRIEKQLRVNKLNENMVKFNSTMDVSFLQNAQVWGASVGAGLFGSPLDTAAVAVSMFAPEMIISGVAKGAGALSNAYKTKRVLDAGAKITRARAQTALVRSATLGKATDEGMSLYSKSRLARGFTPKTLATVDAKVARNAKILEDMSKLSYSNLTALEKSGLDALTVATFDAPQAALKKNLSDNLGVDLYTDKDMMIEILSAGFLGAAVPSIARGVGARLGITPKELSLRKMNELESEIKVKRATGEISVKEANKQLEQVSSIKKGLDEYSSQFKPLHPKIREMVDDLERANVSNNTVVSRVQVALDMMSQGKRPRVSDLPEFESIFSHIHANVLNGLLDGDVISTFGRNLVTSKTDSGVFGLRVNGETGLLGSRMVGGLSEADIQAQLKNLYRGTVLKDPEALNTFKEYSANFNNFVNNLDSLWNRYKELLEENKALLKSGNKAKYKAKDLLNLKKEMQKIYLEYKLTPEELQGLNDAALARRIQKEEGLPISNLTPEQEAYLKEAKDFANKWVVETKKTSRNGEYSLYDFSDGNGKKSYKAFEKYLGELREASEGNLYLADADNIVTNMEKQRVEDFIENMKRGEYVEDTDLNQILGTPIKTFDELKKLDSDATAWEKEATIQQIDLERQSVDPDMQRAKKVLDTMSSKADNKVAVYTPAKQIMDGIQKLKATRYAGAKNLVLDALRKDDSLTNSIIKTLSGENKNKHLKIRIKELMSSKLREAGLDMYTKDIDSIINNTVDLFMKEIENNPNALKGLLSIDTLKEIDPRFSKNLDTDFSAIKSLEQARVSDLNARNENITKAIAERDRLKSSTPNSLSDIRKQQKDLNSQIKSLKEKIKKADPSKTEKLTKKLNKLKEQKKQLTSQVKGAESEYKNTIDSASANVDNLIKERDAADMAAYENILRETESVIQGNKEIVDAISESMASVNTLLQPLEKALDIEMSKLQLRVTNDMRVMTNMLSLMMQYPERASEIITSGATQTWYTHLGSKRNLEYIGRSSVDYIKAMLNELDTQVSSSGQSLKDFFLSESNKDAIEEALVRLKYGETGLQNSDAERVAKVINKHEATLNSGFSKFGSTYSTPMNLFDGGKLRYADQSISDQELRSVMEQMNMERSISVDGLKQLLTTEDGKLVFGDSLVDNADNLIQTEVGKIQKTLNSFFTVKNNIHRKITAWALRDFDLEATFNKKGTFNFNLNEIRDAIVTGNWQNLLDGDFNNLRYVASDLEQLRTIMLGKKEKYPNQINPTKWVNSYLAGFDDLGKVVDGEEVAYMSEFNNRITFRNPEAEINALRKFGHDNLRFSIQRNFEKALKAKYTLGIFGSDPVRIVQDVMNTYELARRKDETFAKELAGKAEAISVPGKDKVKPEDQFAIRKDQRQSVLNFVEQACGLQDSAATGFIRYTKATANILASPLLMKAGLKSISDYGTIWQGLINNAMASGRVDAMATTGRSIKLFIQHPEVARMICAAGVIEQDTVIQKIMNNPLMNLARASENVRTIDKYEAFSKSFADFMLNKLAHITDVTNMNKQVAGLSIQSAIGKNSSTAYKDLAKNFQYALEREGITETDWNVLRKYAIRDINKDIKAPEGSVPYLIFDPFKIRELSDSNIEKILRQGGDLNITSEKIKEYRSELISKAYTMVDSSADEMVSLPSERIMNAMRFGTMKGSKAALGAELLTQFQSFGASMAMNTYGRIIADTVRGETGITLIDMFNPFVKVNKEGKTAMNNNLLKAILTIGLTTMIVDSTIDATTGRIEKPITEDGFNWEWGFKQTTKALGTGGMLLDAVFEGIEGTGQGAGGIALHVAPSASNIIRTTSAITRPIKSQDVEDKPSAVAAAVIQEIARTAGLKSLPVVSIAWQYAIGSYLDQMIKGGPEDYYDMLRARERRNQVVLPWEENPEPLWNRL